MQLQVCVHILKDQSAFKSSLDGAILEVPPILLALLLWTGAQR